MSAATKLGENALVIGLGSSGRDAARLLIHMGMKVRGYDQRRGVGALPEGLEPFLGLPHPPDEAFDNLDLLVLSPGVPPAEFRASCLQHSPKAVIHGELGLALTLIRDDDFPQWPVRPTVMVTGTNGKSTVTALLGKLMEAGDKKAFVGGNLGPTLCDFLLQTASGSAKWPEFLVLETSSFQLETTPDDFPRQVAMILNVSADHMDRYASVDDYAHTKARVFCGLAPEGMALLDAGDPWTDKLRPNRKVTLVGSDTGPHVEGEGDDQVLVVNGDRFARSSLRLPGSHNAKNALFALSAARFLGVDPQACNRGLEAFEGLPHRMVFVRDLDGIPYYNDSKATNVSSAVASLDGIGKKFVLIAGGRSKGDDLTPLREVLAKKGRALVAMGESASRLARMAEGAVPTFIERTMNAAVEKARELAQPGDAVVLAPACSSFDQYRNFAQRGDAFVRAVERLA